MIEATTRAILLTTVLALPLGAAVANDDDDGWTDDLPYAEGPYMGAYGNMGPGAMMMGRGMAGPWGWGMMAPPFGLGPLAMLDLTDDQQKQIDQIRDKLRKDRWQIEGKMLDARSQLRDAWEADKPNPQKVGAAYESMAKLQRELIETDVAAMNRIRDVLTDEQRAQLKRWSRRMMTAPVPPGPPPGPMHGRMMR